MPRGNLSGLAHEDCTVNNGKWYSESTMFDEKIQCKVRNIYHYGTLMMTLQLDPADESTVIRTDPRLNAILYERPEGSQSDKCGLSRIRRSLLR